MEDRRCRCVVFLLMAIVVLLADMPSPAAPAALGRDAASASSATAVVSDDTAAAVAYGRGGRWSQPCDPVESDGEVDESYETEATESGFAYLSEKVSRLKRKVTELKDRYVLARFGNASYADQSIDLNAPSSIAPNWNLTGAASVHNLSRIYENLARLFVLTNLTYEGESTSEERVDFKDDFLGLLQHADFGLRLIMCDLSIKMAGLEITELISNTTEAAIDAISFPAVSSKAERHSRDYHVLRLHEMAADNMTSIFESFDTSADEGSS